MGNYQSMGVNDILKNIYSMNYNQLNQLSQNINNQSTINYSLLNSIKQKNQLLFNKVPQNQYSLVNSFLNSIGVSNQIYNIPNNKSEFISQYQSLEDKYKNEFMLEQKQREQEFIKLQRIRREQYEKELSKFNKSTINAYKIFKLNIQFTMDELKASYKKLALVYHPDRPSGNKEKFQVITKAYLTLLEELKLRKEEKTYQELKTSSRDFIKEQATNQKKNINMKEFNSELFNKIYNENRLHKPEDQGYGEWMSQSNYDDTDIKKNDLFSDKFNINVFNSTFDKQVKKNNEITEYKTPDALYNNSFNSQELGITNVSNFSGNGFSDYKEAHTTSRIIPDVKSLKRINNLDDLKREREKIVPLSQAELRRLNSEKQSKLDLEQKQQENIVKSDHQEFDIYNKMNKRMIESNFLNK